MTGGGPRFGLEVSQNPYLSTDAREMHAILAVTGSGLGALSSEAAEVIIIDCSASMSDPPTKIAAARRATSAAIDVLRDGVSFAVVEGTGQARMVYPSNEALAVATPETRAEAREAVKRLRAMGLTAMSTWLTLALRLLDGHPRAVRHALLLTDGKNESEPSTALAEALGRCRGRFRCDARGIGDRWEPQELRWIVDTLHGAADAVREDSELADDFRTIVQGAMRLAVPELAVRVRCLPGSRVRLLKQVFPTQQDLTGHRVRVDERTEDFPTGPWGDGVRDFQLCVEVDAAGAALGEEISVARVELLLPEAGPVAGCQPAPVLVHWSDDPVLSAPLDPRVAHYTKQREINDAVVAGCDAHRASDLEVARKEWGRAVRLAHEVGNEEILRRLERVVDILDPASGEVLVKEHLDPFDVMQSDIGSVITNRGRAPAAPGPVSPPPGRPGRTCAKCGYASPAAARFCGDCGEPLSEQPV